ncbi:MAG: alpha/beta hydrolase [Proteobacteria bacterium]|nr:alpha/beta hydrolase [Pseudomonadota bacterium]
MPEIMITGPAGRIEGRYKHSKTPGAPVALILHPNPSQGGTMNNKIAYSMFQTFADRGFSTLRFNSRGVGRSQGEFDNGEGELNDAAAALDWLQNVNPQASEVWVSGFSFGAWIGMQLLMRRPEISSYVSVAPPANIYDFNFLAPCPNEGIVIQGNNDHLVNIESVDKLIEKLKDQRGPNGVDYKVVDGAGHFFNNEGELDQVLGSINDYISSKEEVLKKAA